MPASPKLSEAVSGVTCPFCGLLCDDLVVASAGGGLAVRENGCGLAIAGFAQAGAQDPATPRISGRPVTLPEAAAEAARLLRDARQPLIAGLATDVAGARAVGRLADRSGAILDHMNSAAALRNLLVLQDSGWITTTLSEVRNRADLLLVAGGDVVSRFPRFFERCLGRGETLFGKHRQCEVIFLGQGPPTGFSLPGPATTILSCRVERLGEAFGVLRTLLAGRRIDATSAAGLALARWRELAERMKRARYGVVVWAAADFDFPHAELTIQSLCELVKDLNRDTRFSCLPLGGSDGDLTSDAVHLWQTGFGGRTSFAQGVPRYDQYHFSAAHLLGSGEADMLMWVSSFHASRTPPDTAVPTVVLGRAGMTFEREPAVYIPVGTPGIDHTGHLFRTDRVVVLPLGQLRATSLPSVADAIVAIEAAF
jgi:formylmethanofuran dehydrogenase subunit B